MAGRAGRVDARQEEQLDHHEAFALAGLAAALRDVEREAAGVVAARARRLRRGEQLAHVIEQAGVGREVRARRAADRLLVDAHEPLDRAPCRRRSARRAVDGAARSSSLARPPRRSTSWPRCAATSSTSAWLTRLDLPEPETPVTVVSTPSGNATSRSSRLLRVTPVEPQPAVRRARRARAARGSRRTGTGASATASTLRQPGGRAAVENLAAVLAGGRADVDDPVGVPDDVELVLDDEERIAGRLQPVERAQQRLGVGRMQAGRRLVEHVDDAEQVRAHLRRQPQPLQLAGRQRRRAALEREVAEAEIEQHGEPRRRGPRRSAA